MAVAPIATISARNRGMAKFSNASSAPSLVTGYGFRREGCSRLFTMVSAEALTLCVEPSAEAWLGIGIVRIDGESAPVSQFFYKCTFATVGKPQD
jgi:hypothetical protein